MVRSFRSDRTISRISAIGFRRGPPPPTPIVITLFYCATISAAVICLFIFHLVRGSSLSFAVETLALEGQFLQQRRRGEELRPDQILVFQQRVIDGLQTDRVGIEHRAAQI